MRAQEILEAVRDHHRQAAIVPEITLGIDQLHAEIYEEKNGRGVDYQTRRIDALMFDGHQRTAIEIKVDRADVKRETYGKNAPWRAITHRFVYAVPAGLIDPHDMAWCPTALYGCGIWWIHEGGRVEVVRKAIVNRYPEPLPQTVVRTLAWRAANGAPRTMREA